MWRYKVSWLITSICSKLQTVYSELILTLIFFFLKGSLSAALPSDVEPEAEARSPEQRDRGLYLLEMGCRNSRLFSGVVGEETILTHHLSPPRSKHGNLRNLMKYRGSL